MSPKKLDWLFWIALATWIIPWQGKRFLPELLDKAYIQWTFTGVTAILVAVGLFLSYQNFFTNPELRRQCAWTCIGFLFIFSCVVILYGVVTPTMGRVTIFTHDIFSNDLVPKLIEKLYSDEITPEDSKKIAHAIYATSGAKLPYRDSTGSYRLFEPTEDQVKSWLEHQAVLQKGESTLKLLDLQFRQLPYLMAGYIVPLFLVFVGGTLYLTYKKK